MNNYIVQQLQKYLIGIGKCYCCEGMQSYVLFYTQVGTIKLALVQEKFLFNKINFWA